MSPQLKAAETVKKSEAIFLWRTIGEALSLADSAFLKIAGKDLDTIDAETREECDMIMQVFQWLCEAKIKGSEYGQYSQPEAFFCRAIAKAKRNDESYKLDLNIAQGIWEYWASDDHIDEHKYDHDYKGPTEAENDKKFKQQKLEWDEERRKAGDEIVQPHTTEHSD